MTPLDPILRELGAGHRAESASPGVERALEAEFRRRHGRGWRPWLGLAGAAGAAAAVLVGFVLLRPGPVETLELRVAGPKAPEVRLARKAVVAAAAVRKAPRVPAAKKKPAEAGEIATDFFPLRTGPVLAPGEVARVVRTRVPRRELARFGLVGSGYFAAGGPVRDIGADVVFGYDGTARAIRFIHENQ